MEATEVETLVEGKVKDAMRENNAELLRNISSMISQISAPHITNNVVSTAPTLKRKSNQEQFRYNSKVLNKVEEVESCLNSQNLPGANQALIEAKDLIKRRQKLVQLADSSELGWRVVAEYETNPIASDSDDEKRIFKAEARASRKVKADKAKKRPFRTTPYARPRSRPEASATVQSNQSFMSQQRPGLCFACGKQGHWKNECPQRDRNNNKISTNTSILVQTDFSESKHKIGVVDRKGQCENTELKGKVDTPVGRLRKAGSKCFLLNKDKKLSYTRARECILQKLRLVVPNLRLGTHSLRASGATVAANAEGVSDRCLKRHGRWKSDSAKDGYIEDSVEKKLFITKQLGL